MQLTSALMVIKRAANGRFTLLLVCARDTMCPVGHIPVNGAIAGTRDAAALIAAPAVAFSAPAVALVYISHCPPAASDSHLASSAQQPVHIAAAGVGQTSHD